MTSNCQMVARDRRRFRHSHGFGGAISASGGPRCIAGTSVVRTARPPAGTGLQIDPEELAEYPIVTYVFSISADPRCPALFETAGLVADVALTAPTGRSSRPCAHGLGVVFWPGWPSIPPPTETGGTTMRATCSRTHHLDRVSASALLWRLHV